MNWLLVFAIVLALAAFPRGDRVVIYKKGEVYGTDSKNVKPAANRR